MATHYDDYICSYKGHLLAGVDEVGRGPLAGDVVAAAVILNPDKPINGLTDSKKLSDKKRDRFYDLIYENALAVSVGRASVAEIDELNILHASLLAMKRATESLSLEPEFVLVDGNRLPDWSYKADAVVKGDLRVDCISAASIVAKVVRDREMQALAIEYPQYGFEKHKAYPTKLHIEALEKYGPCRHHRVSYGPVRKVLGNL